MEPLTSGSILFLNKYMFSTNMDQANHQEIFKSNVAEFEKCFRELKSELYMRRNEVSKLKSELEILNQENHSLKTSLDKFKKENEENRITMDLFMKKSKEFEPRYYEKRDALIKLELQYKLATSKIEVLTKDIQNSLMEKTQLLRKVDMLEEKQRQESLYGNEISQKLIQIKSGIATVTEDLESLKKEQGHIATLSQQVDLAQETLQKCDEVSKSNEKFKQHNAGLEEQCILLKAKCDKLNEFFTKNVIAQDTDLHTRVLLTQWKKMSTFHKESMETKSALLTDLNRHLCEERLTNLKLIADNEQLRNKICVMEAASNDITSDKKGETTMNNHNQENVIELSIFPNIKVELDKSIITIDSD